MNLNSYEDVLTMYVKQKANLANYQTEVGATNAEIQDVTQGADVLQYFKDLGILSEAAKKSVFDIKQQVFGGDKNEPITDFDGFPAYAPPFPPVSGLRERARERNRRYKAAVGYTKTIGIELGIEEESDPISPENVKPTIDLSAAASGYLFAVVVSGRGQSQSWDVLYQRDGETNWAKATTATGKSVDATITPTTPGKPERIKVRVQLKKANVNYGQASDISEITLNP